MLWNARCCASMGAATRCLEIVQTLLMLGHLYSMAEQCVNLLHSADLYGQAKRLRGTVSRVRRQPAVYRLFGGADVFPFSGFRSQTTHLFAPAQATAPADCSSCLFQTIKSFIHYYTPPGRSLPILNPPLLLTLLPGSHCGCIARHYHSVYNNNNNLQQGPPRAFPTRIG